MFERLKNHPILTFFTSAVIVILALISFVNQLNYETYALDLGAYTNAMFQYSNFELADTRVFEQNPKPILSDHFDLYLITFSPLLWLFGSYTLLIVQFLSSLVGCLGLYRLLRFMGIENARYAPLYLLSFFGVVSAFGFDYHSNVVAVFLIPWFLLYLLKGKNTFAGLFFIAILISKENTGLLLGFLLLGVSLDKQFEKIRWHLWIFGALGIVYSVIVVGLIMPWVEGGNVYSNYKYTVGSNFGDLLSFVLRNPLEFITLLFGNHIADSDFPVTQIKIEQLVFLVGSGGLLLIRKPWFLICLLPILVQKFLHSNVNIVGIGSHYSIEFAMIFALAVPLIIADLKLPFKSEKLMILIILVSCGFSIRMMDNSINYIPKGRLRFYQHQHYVREDIPRNYISDAIKNIPEEVSVSASSNLVPHLACRDTIYTFPNVGNAKYIIVGDFNNSYPITTEIKDNIIDLLITNNEYRVVQDKNGIQILERINSFSESIF